MVNVRVLLFAGAVSFGGCGNLVDVPEKCEPDTADNRVAIISFGGVEDEFPLRYCVDVNVASRRDADAMSPGRDESFATSRAGVIPWTNLTYNEAALACGRAGKTLCERRVLRTLTPIMETPSGLNYDKTTIDALSPTMPDDPPDSLEPMVVEPAFVPVAFPDVNASVAVWTVEGYVVGALLGARAQSGNTIATAIPSEPEFKHPLLGFRCCVDARLQGVFTPLPPDPSLIRSEVDNVPIAR